MRKTLVLARTEWQHVLRDKVAILMLAILPLIFTAVLSLIFGGAGNAALRIGLVAGDPQLTPEVRQALDRERGLQVTLVGRSEAEDRLRRASLDAALVVPTNATDGLQVMTDASTERGYQAYTKLVGVQAAVSGKNTAVALANDLLPAGIDTAKVALLYAENPVPDVSMIRSWKDVAEGVVQVSPGMLVMFVLMFAAFSGEGIVLERLNGTLRRLFAAPVTGWQYLIGRMLGKVSLAMVQFLLLAAFGALILKVNWGSAPGYMLLTGLIFACTCASFGLFLGVICRTSDQLSALATVVCLALAALGGTWWPIDVAPQAMQAIGHALPTGMAMKAFQALILHGADGLADAKGAWLGLVSWAVGFLVIGVTLFRTAAKVTPRKALRLGTTRG